MIGTGSSHSKRPGPNKERVQQALDWLFSRPEALWYDLRRSVIEIGLAAVVPYDLDDPC